MKNVIYNPISPSYTQTLPHHTSHFPKETISTWMTHVQSLFTKKLLHLLNMVTSNFSDGSYGLKTEVNCAEF